MISPIKFMTEKKKKKSSVISPKKEKSKSQCKVKKTPVKQSASFNASKSDLTSLSPQKLKKVRAKLALPHDAYLNISDNSLTLKKVPIASQNVGCFDRHATATREELTSKSVLDGGLLKMNSALRSNSFCTKPHLKKDDPSPLKDNYNALKSEKPAGDINNFIKYSPKIVVNPLQKEELKNHSFLRDSAEENYSNSSPTKLKAHGKVPTFAFKADSFELNEDALKAYMQF